MHLGTPRGPWEQRRFLPSAPGEHMDPPTVHMQKQQMNNGYKVEQNSSMRESSEMGIIYYSLFGID